MHRSHDGAEGFQDHKIFDSRVLYKWVSRNFVTQGLFDFIMARIQLLLLALLASSIFVRAKSVSYQYGDIREASGRFKLIVKDSYSDSTFIYIKTTSIEGSIFHLPSNFVRSASTLFLSHQLAQIIITIGPIHSKPNYPG